MRIAIASDHAGFLQKAPLAEYLRSQGHEVLDCGPATDDRCDYPDYGDKVARLVAKGEVERGVLICGTGVGISLAANKVHGIRACVCSDPYSAKLSREHNNTNIIAFGARVVGPELAKMIVDEWLGATFQGGRHQRRIDMLAEIEETQNLTAAQ